MTPYAPPVQTIAEEPEPNEPSYVDLGVLDAYYSAPHLPPLLGHIRAGTAAAEYVMRVPSLLPPPPIGTRPHRGRPLTATLIGAALVCVALGTIVFVAVRAKQINRHPDVDG